MAGRPPWHGSAAEQADAILSQGVRTVAAFHTIAGHELQRLDKPSRATCSCAATTPMRRRWWARSCGHPRSPLGGLRRAVHGAHRRDHDRPAGLREPHVQGARRGVPHRGARRVGRSALVSAEGELVRIDDTSLFVVERGAGHPVIVLHGGPGLDHHEFADYLDPLTDEFRLLLVDQRANGRSERSPESTWTLERMARTDHAGEGDAPGPHAVLGHSYGAFVALQNAVDTRYGDADDRERRCPVHEVPGGGRDQPRRVRAQALREQVIASWAREPDVTTPEGVRAADGRAVPVPLRRPARPPHRGLSGADLTDRLRAGHASRVLRERYGGIEVEDRLGDSRSQCW